MGKGICAARIAQTAVWSDAARESDEYQRLVQKMGSRVFRTNWAEVMAGFNSSQKSNHSNKSSSLSEYVDVEGDGDMDQKSDEVMLDDEMLPADEAPLPQNLTSAGSSPPQPEHQSPENMSQQSNFVSNCSDPDVISDPQPHQSDGPMRLIPNSRQDQVRAEIRTAGISRTEKTLLNYGNVIDDMAGVNNYAPVALKLSNRCSKIETVTSFFDLNSYDSAIAEMTHSGVIEDEIPDVIPVPRNFSVPMHLRRKRPVFQPQPQKDQLKHQLIENLSDPDIEEIAFVANNKKDGDLRDFMSRGNAKTFPQTAALQKVANSRPAASASAGDDDEYSSGYRLNGRGGKRGNSNSRFTGKDVWNKRRPGHWNKNGDEDDEDDADGAGDYYIKQNSVPKIAGFVSGRELNDLIQKSKNGGTSLVHGMATAAATKPFVNPNPKPQSGAEKLSLCPDDQIPNVDDHLVQRVLNEIVVSVQNVSWNDIAGLELEKKRIGEVVVYPLLRPDIFQGIRAPSKGLLLFGPPGTGKSMIGKCIASQSKATFFSVSSSSLTSKWIGEGEKLVRAMFAVARKKQPSVIFIDEIDSLLAQRTDQDHEASIRLKTEFLMQFEGVTSSENDRLLVVGATNRPDALDEAARRRFDKRLMIGLPDDAARMDMVRKHMAGASCNLSEEDLKEIAALTNGYSGSDMKFVCKEAAMGPIRSAISSNQIDTIQLDELRQVDVSDFRAALREVKASVAESEVEQHENFNRRFGALGV
jgi:SpoVK/Ycf46/Vps4 family AAA+-type ATPase